MLVEGNGEEETPVLSCRSHLQKMRGQFLAVMVGKSTHLFLCLGHLYDGLSQIAILYHSEPC